MYSIFITKKHKTSVVIFDIMKEEVIPTIKAFELLRKSDIEPFKREDYEITVRNENCTTQMSLSRWTQKNLNMSIGAMLGH